MDARLIADRYRLVEPVGHGGMSEVWLAEDAELGRLVALKLLGPEADGARFEREARAAASLGGQGVTQVYDYGDAGGRPFMVLEYLPGGTLEERLRPGRPLPVDEVRRIAADVATGLAHAHEQGLVHRDLKPANVLFDAEDRAKIADFGVVRLGGAGTLTEAGTVLGTAAYISPEQAAGLPASPASDVYSIGVILFRMLTGRLPFESGQPLELLALHRHAEPPSVTDLRPDAPADLAALTAAALAKDPRDRPADGGALASALAAPEPEPETAVLPLGDPGGRRRRPLLLGSAAALLAGAGVALALAVSSERGSTSRVPVGTGGRQLVTAPATHPATSTATGAATAATLRGTTAARTGTRSATTAATTAGAGVTILPGTTAPPPTVTTEPTTTDVSTAESTATTAGGTTAGATTAPGTTAGTAPGG